MFPFTPHRPTQSLIAPGGRHFATDTLRIRFSCEMIALSNTAISTNIIYLLANALDGHILYLRGASLESSNKVHSQQSSFPTRPSTIIGTPGKDE